ncbi:MAG: hypothetical protein QM784_32915 [Polyangiaceae bacterium]
MSAERAFLRLTHKYQRELEPDPEREPASTPRRSPLSRTTPSRTTPSRIKRSRQQLLATLVLGGLNRDDGKRR